MNVYRKLQSIHSVLEGNFETDLYIFRIEKFLECTGGYFGVLLEFLWNFFFSWSSSGVLLEFFWRSSGVLLEFFWSSSGVILEFFFFFVFLEVIWGFFGVLVFLLVSFVVFFVFIWSSSGVLVFLEVSEVVLEISGVWTSVFSGSFWSFSGVFLECFWSSSGVLLEFFWFFRIKAVFAIRLVWSCK